MPRLTSVKGGKADDDSKTVRKPPSGRPRPNPRRRPAPDTIIPDDQEIAEQEAQEIPFEPEETPRRRVKRKTEEERHGILADVAPPVADEATPESEGGEDTPEPEKDKEDGKKGRPKAKRRPPMAVAKPRNVRETMPIRRVMFGNS